MRYILKIERHLRSLISYYFSEKFGVQQQYYLDPTNYCSSTLHHADVIRLIKILDDLANHNTDYSYINYQRNNYSNVPLWVLVNGITFGTLSKLYSFLPQDLKAKVAKNFHSVNERQLEQYMKVITKFRNVCAHNERLYSYRTRNDIPDTLLHKKLMILQKGTTYIFGKKDLFALVISFRYLLNNAVFLTFKYDLGKMISRFLVNQAAISEEEILTYMGFPSNWSEIARYRF